MHSQKSDISLWLRFARPTLGALLIVRVRNSVRPNHLFESSRREKCPEVGRLMTHPRGTVAKRSARVPDLHLITCELLELI